MGGPTLESVTAAVCPENKPFKCLPWGGCYGYQSYCDRMSRAAESCFPSYLTGDTAFLNWCRDVKRNASLLLHPQCKFACDDRFNQSQLYPSQSAELDPNQSQLHLNQSVLSPVTTAYCDCFTFQIFAAVVSVCVVICIILLVVQRNRGSILCGKATKNPENKETGNDAEVGANQPEAVDNDINVRRGLNAPEVVRDSGMELQQNASTQHTQHEERNPEMEPLLEGDNLNIRPQSQQQAGNSDDRQQTAETDIHQSGTGSSRTSPSSSLSNVPTFAPGIGNSGAMLNRSDSMNIHQHPPHIPAGMNQGYHDYTTDRNSPTQNGQNVPMVVSPTSPDEGTVSVVTNQTVYSSRD